MFEPEHNGITIDYSETVVDPQWDNFLDQLPSAHFEQTSMWGQLRSHYGWQPVRWVARQNSRVVGGLQLLSHPFSRLGKIGYVVRGPMCEKGHSNLEEQLVDAVTLHAHQHQFVYLVFDLPYDGHDLGVLLDRKNYASHPSTIPPTGLITATLVLDLHTSLEGLLKNMGASVRRNIRYANRSGLEMSFGNENDLQTFRDLMLAICNRRGTAPTPPQRDFFERLWEAMGASGLVKLFLVRLGEEVVSAAIAFTLGDTVRVWKVGWSGAHPDRYPNYFMWWSMIKWAEKNGFRHFDFVWVDEEDAKLLSHGEKRPEAFRDGTTVFKSGFGGHLLMLPHARSQFFHPALRCFVRAGGMHLLSSHTAQSLLSRLWSRNSG